MLARLLVVWLVLVSSAAAAGRLEVHFLDVGQGDAAFVRSPAGKTLLIDAGRPDSGATIRAYLRGRAVTGIDLALASHAHLDHIGGMLEVLQSHRPGVFLDPAYPHPLRSYDALLAWLEAEKIPVRTARGGRTITVEPGIVLELLAPDEPLLSGTRSDANANSAVARLVFGEVSFLFTGDAEHDTEERLLASGRPLRSTVLKVAHHGSRHSTSDRWLAAVQPDFAVISAASDNPYGHPIPQTLNRLANRGVRVFRTDRDGHVVASTDGAALKWSVSRGVREQDPEQQRVDVNTASRDELMTLPGIGPALADRIVNERERKTFANLEALGRVSGIGRKTVERLRSRAFAGSAEQEKPQ